MNDNNYPKVKIIHSIIENGVTKPKIATLEDDTTIVLKEFNGEQGNLVIFNEFLCYRLAILIGLPMPKSGLCILDDTCDNNEFITEKNFGTCFYSTYLNKVTPIKEGIIPLITNQDIFYKLIIFDHIIYNWDRNPGNLLVRFYKNDIKLYVIDHSHVFKNQTIWDSQCLEDGIKEFDILDTRILKENETIYSMFFNKICVEKEKLINEKILFQKLISYDIIYGLIAECPNSIKPTEKDIDSLIKYLLYRIDNLDRIISTICSYIKI